MPQRHLPPDRNGRDTGSSHLSRRALFATTAFGLPAALTTLSMAPAVADPSVTDGETRILDVPLVDSELVDADGAPARDLPEQPATMVGVTWPAESPVPTVHARGRAEDDSWTEWFELESALDPETGDAAPGTEVAWLGAVSALQIRAEVDGADVTAEMTAHLITTSETEADQHAGEFSGPYTSQSQSLQAQQARPQTMSARAASNPSTPTLPGSTPSFVTRRSWGADEGRTGATYGRDELKAVVIHHTAGSNNYSSGQSGSIVRGIHDYHTRTLGWADIGYNILIDKYGRIFEGRSGGLHRNIQGAHATGFNRGSFGISVLGHHSATNISAATRDAIARVVSWKLLSTFQESVWSQATWTSIGSGTRFAQGSTQTLATVMGHRDVNYTECPGARIYNQFDRIRGDAQYYIDRGWKHHLNAFKAAGGASTLGTVTHSAHSTGSYWVTKLTKGLVLHQGNGAATGYVSEVAEQWQQSWGRPYSGPRQDGDRRIQAFQNGTVAVEDGEVRFMTPTFNDVHPGRVFFLEIEDLATRGITEGWGPEGNRSFRPNADNLRDAMIVFIYRAMGSPIYTAPRTSPFADVSTDFVFYKELCWAFDEGIAEGWGSGGSRRFRPLIPVKRDAVAAFLYRAAGAPSASKSDAAHFTDVPSSHVFAKEIGWLAKTGISRGWDDGTFRPDAHIKRDQMATFVMRWMKHTGKA